MRGMLCSSGVVAACFWSVSVAGAAVMPGWECIPATAGQAVTSGGVKPTPSCASKTTAVLAPTYVSSGADGRPTVEFSGVDVQIVDGSGSTSSPNGTGNLVLGYDESPGTQSGSHDLILGEHQTFSGYGDLVAGYDSTVSGSYAAALGHGDKATGSYSFAAGYGNTSEGPYSSVTGGEYNLASDPASSIAGGCDNLAGAGPQPMSSCSKSGVEAVLGGIGNTASDFGASVEGGETNTASGAGASVAGGEDDTATGSDSSVTGGSSNKATDFADSVTGGNGNSAGGDYGSISGGAGNTTSNFDSSVTAGALNTASGLESSVTGGEYNTAVDDFGVVAGGCSNFAGTPPASFSVNGDCTSADSSGDFDSVTGGVGNQAPATNSTVSGGYSNIANGIGASVSGGEYNTATDFADAIDGGCDNVAGQGSFQLAHPTNSPSNGGCQTDGNTDTIDWIGGGVADQTSGIAQSTLGGLALRLPNGSDEYDVLLGSSP